MAMEQRQPPEGQDQGTAERPGLVTLSVVLDWCAGIVLSPVPTFRAIVQQRPMGAALAVAAVVGAVSGAASLGSADIDALFGTRQTVPLGVGGGFMVLGLFIGAIGTIVALTVGSLIFHLIAKMLGGGGNLGGLIAAWGFASVINVFSVPLTLLSAFGGLAAAGVAGLGQIALFVWGLVLSVLALRENYAVSTGTAVGILIIGLIAIGTVVFVFVLLFVLLVVLGLAVAVV